VPLGFLKSVRDQAAQARMPAPAAASPLPAARPERVSVLSEIEQLGVGMF
jgi:hypothetical protein